MFKQFKLFWKAFFILVWDVIKTMKTLRGLIALGISYMLFQGWAILFILFGNAYLKGVGALVLAFWFGPGTPTIPLILVAALLIQRYILLDSSNHMRLKEKWKQLSKKDL